MRSCPRGRYRVLSVAERPTDQAQDRPEAVQSKAESDLPEPELNHHCRRARPSGPSTSSGQRSRESLRQAPGNVSDSPFDKLRATFQTVPSTSSGQRFRQALRQAQGNVPDRPFDKLRATFQTGPSTSSGQRYRASLRQAPGNVFRQSLRQAPGNVPDSPFDKLRATFQTVPFDKLRATFRAFRQSLRQAPGNVSDSPFDKLRATFQRSPLTSSGQRVRDGVPARASVGKGAPPDGGAEQKHAFRFARSDDAGGSERHARAQGPN